MSDYCPFEPSEPRCRECRGKPCGDEPDVVDLADEFDAAEDHFSALGY